MSNEVWNPAVAVSAGALAVSIAAFVISWYRNLRSTQLRSAQDDAMRAVAARAVLLWDQLIIIVVASVNNTEVHPYMFPSVQKNARRLDDALDQALRVGLIEDISGRGRAHALTLYSAFTQGLVEVAELNSPEKQPLDAWHKQHLLMGMVRLLDVCRKYRTPVLSLAIVESALSQLDQTLEEAWTYVLRK